MNRPRNTYTPATPLAPPLHAIGRPVTMFRAGGVISAGTVVRVVFDAEQADFRYDVHAVGGGLFTDQRLGTLNDPQPNTFVYAP